MWKTIDSAPRDGTRILCYSPGNKRAYNGFAKDEHWKVDYVHPRFGNFYSEYPEARYTHWKPLDRPARKEESGQ